MKKRLSLMLALGLSFAAAAVPALAARGHWNAAIERNPANIYFKISYVQGAEFGSTMDMASFAGLDLVKVRSAATQPIQFEMRRDAGDIFFEGSFLNGRGKGELTYRPQPAYLDSLRALGVDNDLHRRNSRLSNDADATMMAALHDVSIEFIKSMQAEGYKESLNQYVEMRIHDVTRAYITELRSLGFGDLTARQLVSGRIHGITPQYIREVKAAGWQLSFGELESSRIHGVTPAFAEEIRMMGYGRLKFDTLVDMRVHKVTPAFIREVEAAGYRNVPVEKLITMRVHGMDAEYLKKMRAAPKG